MVYLGSKKKTRRKRGSDERKTLIEKLDKVFSIYIRLRDSKEFHYKAFRCISCGDVKPFDMMDCGHFVSRNCMPLRFDEENCNGECSKCNRFSGSHLLGYRRNLIIKLGTAAIKDKPLVQSLDNQKKLEIIKKIGEERVMALESMSKKTKKWDVDDLRAMYIYYAEKIMEMKKEM